MPATGRGPGGGPRAGRPAPPRPRRAQTRATPPVSVRSCRHLVAAAATDCAAASAACGAFEPLSAACTAVHSGSEIFGYLVPRLSAVRPFAALTAWTHTVRSGLAATCLPCTAEVAAT